MLANDYPLAASSGRAALPLIDQHLALLILLNSCGLAKLFDHFTFIHSDKRILFLLLGNAGK